MKIKELMSSYGNAVERVGKKDKNLGILKEICEVSVTEQI